MSTVQGVNHRGLFGYSIALAGAVAFTMKGGKRLRRIIDSIPALVAYIDRRECHGFCNRQYQEWFGLPAHRLCGKHLREVLGDESYERVRGHVTAALSGMPITFETVLPHREYGPRWVSATHVPDSGRRGAMRGFVSLMVDVTASRRGETSQNFLSEASHALAKSFDVQVAMQSVAKLCVSHFADRCVVQLLGEGGIVQRTAVACPVAEEEDPTLQFILGSRLPLGVQEGLPRVLRTGRGELHEEVTDELLCRVARSAEHLDSLRRIGLRSLIIVPMIARGRALGTITIASIQEEKRFGDHDLALAQDLAQRAAIAIDNARLYQEATEAIREKDDFLAVVSHELRNPLHNVLGWAQLIKKGEMTPQEITGAAERIEHNAKSQVQLIEELLEVTRIVHGGVELSMVSLSLPDLIESAVSNMTLTARSKGIEVTSQIDRELPPVLGDPSKLQRVVLNLLSNAIKFTPEGGKVVVTLERQGSEAVISVIDTGRGISREFLPHVFERFRQADMSGIGRQGLGLGLAIARHLVELHCGKVEAESAGPGQGAKFTVRLPLDVAVSQSPFHPRAISGAPIPEQCPPSLAGLRVLVVDDEAEARQLITTVLESCEAQVSSAGSAAEAIAEMERFRPDVVLVDIDMPGANGYDLMHEIRNREATTARRTPAAALTANARSEDRLRAFMAGFDLHLIKPVEPQKLVEAVAGLARKKAW